MAANRESPMPNLDKIGNLIIYLVDEIDKKYRQKVFLTKLLKLLYIIDETAVKETGVPVTGMDYRVWKMGPVPYPVYKDLMHDNSEKLSFFAEAHKKNDGEWALINSVNNFRDSEFSDYEMDLIDRIINEYGYYQPDALVNHLHKQDSLWKQIVDEHKLEKWFEKESTSQYNIDLSQLVANDPVKLEMFRNARESLNL
jgi:uncharacterized phage-associated protein